MKQKITPRRTPIGISRYFYGNAIHFCDFVGVMKLRLTRIV